MVRTPLTALPQTSIARQVWWLATPVLVEQALLYLVGLSDTILTGHYLEADHLAAVTVASYLMWFLGSLLTIVSVGATALVARRVGADDVAAASRTCRQAIGLAVVLGVVIVAIGWGTTPALVRALNLEGLAAASAVTFFRIVLTVTPLLACTAVGIACLRGAGDTRTGMYVMLLVNLINAGLSWSLVRGYGPFPALGFPGIAIGTAVGEAVGGLVVLAVLIRGRAGLQLDHRVFRPDPEEIRRIIRVSSPAAGESLTNTFCQLWFLGVINALGPIATAAHGVAIRCESIGFLTIQAFSVAASTLTGQYLGAGRPDLAARSAATAWALGMAVLTALGVLLYIEAGPMFWVFLGNRQSEVTDMGVPVLRIIAFALPALATLNVLSGTLRGAGDTRWPWYIVLIGYLAVRMPLTYYLALGPERGGLGWGLKGAWIAMFLDLHVRAILIAGRFLQGGWKATRV